MAHTDLLEIKGPQTIPVVERELAELHAMKPRRLLVPVKLKESWIGGQASVIQLLATWGSRHRDATLVTHIRAGEPPETQLRRLANKPYGFCAIWMADRVTDRPGDIDLKVLANGSCDEQFDIMWKGGQRRKTDDQQPSLFGDESKYQFLPPRVGGVGQQVFVAAIDHDRWQIPTCYFPDGSLRERDDFTALARTTIERVSQTPGASPVTPDLYSAIGAIYHELFKNTHEHARTDINGAKLRRSVRGVVVNRRTWSGADVDKVVAESPPLQQFADHHGFRDLDGRLRLIEISVFDSGIGLAARWLKDRWSNSMSCVAELDACQECLKRWASSTDKPHKGAGLHEVAITLSALKAFMRLRTGRLSLFHDFAARPVTNDSKQSTVDLLDWTTGTVIPSEMAPVAGVLFTMLIPVLN